jgi:hypothetical protein
MCLRLWTVALMTAALATGLPVKAGMPEAGSGQQVDLAERLAAGKLRVVNREATPLTADRPGVHLSEKEGNGVAWVEGTDFAQGTLEVAVRGRDVFQRSFLGIAFHRKDDNTYDAVYVRPFNFRATDPSRHEHAVQYISVPEHDWPRLRKEFPEEFENPVEPSVAPADWVSLRIVVKDRTIQVHVGSVTSPTLEVRKLGSTDRGAVGLWVGNGSDGDFANLRMTPAR